MPAFLVPYGIALAYFVIKIVGKRLADGVDADALVAGEIVAWGGVDLVFVAMSTSLGLAVENRLQFSRDMTILWYALLLILGLLALHSYARYRRCTREKPGTLSRAIRAGLNAWCGATIGVFALIAEAWLLRN